MSDRISRLLERVAREVSDLNKHDVIVVEALELLEERLGPLFRAGHEMRNRLETIGMTADDYQKSVVAWDSALATLEGRDGK